MGGIPLAFYGHFTVFIGILAFWPQRAENPTAGEHHLRKRRGPGLIIMGILLLNPQATAAECHSQK
jgi:hypothetical protein